MLSDRVPCSSATLILTPPHFPPHLCVLGGGKDVVELLLEHPARQRSTADNHFSNGTGARRCCTLESASQQKEGRNLQPFRLCNLATGATAAATATHLPSASGQLLSSWCTKMTFSSTACRAQVQGARWRRVGTTESSEGTYRRERGKEGACTQSMTEQFPTLPPHNPSAPPHTPAPHL